MNNKGVFTVILALTCVVGFCATLIILLNREEHKRTVNAILGPTERVADGEGAEGVKEEAALIQIPELVEQEEAVEELQ